MKKSEINPVQTSIWYEPQYHPGCTSLGPTLRSGPWLVQPGWYCGSYQISVSTIYIHSAFAFLHTIYTRSWSLIFNVRLPDSAIHCEFVNIWCISEERLFLTCLVGWVIFSEKPTFWKFSIKAVAFGLSGDDRSILKSPMTKVSRQSSRGIWSIISVMVSRKSWIL